MQHVHNLPNPRQAGYSWPEFEEGLASYQRVRKVARQIEGERHSLEAEINSLKREDRKRLGEAMLAGGRSEAEEEDPKILELQKRARKLERDENALHEVAIPRAESELGAAIGMNRLEWNEELWEDLPKRIEAAREAAASAGAMLQSSMQRLAQTLSLIDWTTSNNPFVYSPPDAGRAISEALATIHGHLAGVERKLEERRQEQEAEEERRAERRRRIEAGEVKTATAAGPQR